MKQLLLLSTLLLLGCTGDAHWNTTNITDVLPDLEFKLTNEQGETVTEQDYLGETTAVFFGYTNCPDICPITMGKLRSAIAALPEDQQNDIQVLFVSVDPKRDTPQHLAEYTNAFGPQFIGLTSDVETLKELTKHYRATFSYGDPLSEGGYPVSHPSAVYVFDAQGEARLLMGYNDTVQAITEDFGRLIEQA